MCICMLVTPKSTKASFFLNLSHFKQKFLLIYSFVEAHNYSCSPTLIGHIHLYLLLLYIIIIICIHS